MKSIEKIIKEHQLEKNIKDSTEFPIRKYDERGNLVYVRDSMGEVWNKYDKNNHEIYSKFDEGDGVVCESWRKYDTNGKLVYYKDTYGYKTWYEYKKNTLTKQLEKDYKGYWKLNGQELIKNKK